MKNAEKLLTEEELDLIYNRELYERLEKDLPLCAVMHGRIYMSEGVWLNRDGTMMQD